MLPRAAETTEPNPVSREAPRSHPLRLVAAEAPSAACVTPAVCEEDEWSALLTRVKGDTQDLTEEQEWEAQMKLVRAEVDKQEEREWLAQVEQRKAQIALEEEREWLAAKARLQSSAPPSSQPRYEPTRSSILPKPMVQARGTVLPAQPSEESSVSLRFTLPEEKAREEAAQKPVPSRLPPRTSSLGLPRVSSPSLLNGRASTPSPLNTLRPSAPSPLPLRTTPQLARQSATTRPSQLPPRAVAKSTLPAAPQRPEVARLLARANKPRTEQPPENQRAQHSGVHRRSDVQGTPAQVSSNDKAEANKKKDSSLLILSRTLEAIEKESTAARPSRTMPPAPPRSTWPQAKTLSGAAVAAKPTESSDEVWPDPKTLRGAAVAPAPMQPAEAPASQPMAPEARASEPQASAKKPLRLPPLPPKGVSTRPKAPPPPLPRRAGSKNPTSAARTAQKPLVIPAPPPRTAADSGQSHGFAQSVWSAVASFTTRGGRHK